MGDSGEVADGLIAALVADVDSPGSLLVAACAPYGVALDGEMSEDDAEEYYRFRIGERGDPPPGLSFEVLAEGSEQVPLFAPGPILAQTHSATVRILWRDEPTVAGKLTGKPRRVRRFLAALSRVVVALLHPRILAPMGIWTVGETAYHSVLCALAEPDIYEEERRNMVLHSAEIAFICASLD